MLRRWGEMTGGQDVSQKLRLGYGSIAMKLPFLGGYSHP
jgi:hypothetical protein